MGGEPWAQDPVGMHVLSYRDRYYAVRQGMTRRAGGA